MPPIFKKKCPQLKFFFQIPLTHLPQCPQFWKKNAPRWNFFSNSTNTFAQLPPIFFKNAPNFFFNYHIKKICPQLNNLPPFLSNSSIPNGIEKGIILTPELTHLYLFGSPRHEHLVTLKHLFFFSFIFWEVIGKGLDDFCRIPVGTVRVIFSDSI